MRKIYCCLAWAVLAVGLTACGNNQQTTEPVQENKAAIEAPADQEATPPPVQEATPEAAPSEHVAPADQEATPEAAPPAEQAAPAEQEAPPPDTDQAPPADDASHN